MTRYILLATCALCGVCLVSETSAQSAISGEQHPRPGRKSTPQPKQQGLEEIVVTAQKRSERLQKVPITITAISSARLAANGVRTTQDLASAVPGLQIVNIADDVTPRLRGVGTAASAAGLESAVATYVDGVYYAYGADVNLDLSDVTQVSVLKGPQGTLFGRNATGGVLQINTREPSEQFQGSVGTSLDNYLTTRSDLYVTGGLAANLAASLTLQYVNQGYGWGTNIHDGSPVHKIDNDVSARLKMTWKPDDLTTIRFEADYTSRSGPTAANFRPFPGYNALFPSPQSSNPWSVDNFLDSTSNYTGGGLALNATRDLGFAKLTSISAYRDSTLRFGFTPGISATPTFGLLVPESSSQFSEELQLVSPSGGRFNWALGTYYFYNRAEQNQQVTFYDTFVAPFLQIISPAVQNTNSVAGFAQGTYRITPHTRFTAGFRYTYETKAFVGQENGTFPAGPPVTLYSTKGTVNASFEKPTWRFALDQDVVPDVIAYVSYNRGFKSGGFNIRTPSNPPFAPEQLDAYEVGVKAEALDKRLRVNVSGYDYQYRELQVPVFGITEVIVNGASARIYGIDADAEAKVTEGLRVFASANLLHARFKSFQNAPFSIPGPSNEGATLVTGDASGKTLPYSPAFTSTVGVDYQIQSAVGDFNINLTDSYNSGFYSEADNRLRQTAYQLLDASLVWKSTNLKYTATLFINNILNKAVASQFASLSTGYIADYSNPPRIYGASVKVSF